MSVAKVARLDVGRVDKTRVYVRIKNGNVYRFRTPLTGAQRNKFLLQVHAAGRVQLKYWERVR